jgi:sec-independent protein translocase protein TatC
MAARVEPDDPFESTRMSLGEHLAELQSRLLKGGLALFAAFLIGWGLGDRLTGILLRPYHEAVRMINADLAEKAETALAAEPETPRTAFFLSDDPQSPQYRELRPGKCMDTRPIATGVLEGFMFKLRTSTYFALAFGAPVLLWQLWQFVAAGLYPHERRALTRYVPWSLGLFALGFTFSYLWVVGPVIYFAGLTIDIDVVRPEWRLEDYFGFFMALSLGMALIFQIPVVMIFLMRLGLVEPATFAKYRGHWVLGSFVLAAIVSPPDLYSTVVMSVPAIVLYELGIVVGRFVARPREIPRAKAA